METFIKSIPAPGKEKNGDASWQYEDEKSKVLIIADGVGGKPCDWKASDTICQSFAMYFAETRQLLLKDAIMDSLQKAFVVLYEEKGQCGGMLTTLAGVAVDKIEQRYYYWSIGDSEIFLIQDGRIRCITSISPFVQSPVELGAKVKEIKCTSSALSFVLVTDGFSDNRKLYQQELVTVMTATDWETKMHELVKLNQLTQFDDMTVAILKTE